MLGWSDRCSGARPVPTHLARRRPRVRPAARQQRRVLGRRHLRSGLRRPGGHRVHRDRGSERSHLRHPLGRHDRLLGRQQLRSVGSALPAQTYTDISAGDRHTCAIRTSGTVDCWGDDSDGQTNAPDGTFESLSVATTWSCGIRSDGSATCWGTGFLGSDVLPSVPSRRSRRGRASAAASEPTAVSAAGPAIRRSRPTWSARRRPDPSCRSTPPTSTPARCRRSGPPAAGATTRPGARLHPAGSSRR